MWFFEAGRDVPEASCSATRCTADLVLFKLNKSRPPVLLGFAFGCFLGLGTRPVEGVQARPYCLFWWGVKLRAVSRACPGTN